MTISFLAPIQINSNMRVFPKFIGSVSQNCTSGPIWAFFSLLLGLSLMACQSQLNSPPTNQTYESKTPSQTQAAKTAHDLYTLGIAAKKTKSYDVMVENFSAAVDSFVVADLKDSAYLAASQLIAAYYYSGSCDQAILVHNRFQEDFSPADTSIAIAMLVNNVSPCYSELFQDPTAKAILEQVYEIHSQRIIAGIDSGIGGNLLSFNFTNQALILYRTGATLNDVGFSEKASRRLSTSLAKFDTVESVFQKFDMPQSFSQQASQINNKGLVMVALGEYDQALAYFEEAKKLELTNNQANSYLATNIRFDKGFALLNKGDLEGAAKIYEETTELYENQFKLNDLELFECYGMLARTYNSLEEYDKALFNTQKALAAYSLGKPKLTDSWQSPPLDQLLARVELLDILVHKLVALEHLADLENPQDIQRILPTYELAFDLLKRLKFDSCSETNSYFISFYGSEILRQYLRLAKHMDNLVVPAFQEVDNNRASYLQQGLTLNRLQSNNALPDSLKQLESQLNNGINMLSMKRIYFSKYGPQYSPMVESFEAGINSLKAQKESFVQLLKAEYPSYYDLRYDTTSALSQAKILLEDGQVLLEYFIGEEFIYTFRVDADGLQMFTSPNDSVEYWIKQMTGEALYDVGQAKMDFLPFAEKLFHRLIKPAIADLDPSYSRMIIVPDGFLASLPFGMLVSEASNTDLRVIPYLMKDFAISYGYSTSSFAMQKQQYTNRSLPKGSLLAVAPSFPTSSNAETDTTKLMAFTNLTYNVEEINNINVAAKKMLKGNKATPETFLKLWNKYQFIHLATHAISNPAFPEEAGIAFSNDGDQTSLLRLKDLPDQPWYAKMLVLSACQTASGQVVSGEGIISLAHGFALKGIQSIVATQWSVKDPPTARLMDQFYDYLLQGEPRDIALQKAQLSLVEGGVDRKYQDGHPLYWAAFTLYGDPSPVSFPEKKYPSTSVIIVGLLGLIIAALGWKRFKRKT